MLTTQKIDITSYMRKVKTLQKELNDIRQTSAADVSLFVTLENKLKQYTERLEI